MLVLAGGIVRPLRFIPLQLLVFRLRGLGMRVFVTGGAGFIRFRLVQIWSNVCLLKF